ncbi:hypothetical protein MPER_09120 [Moniliophthora perniciosa FA553]|nr:hypothetical protein MPER_09120 [Moniliophthora perniciosa FA553]
MQATGAFTARDRIERKKKRTESCDRKSIRDNIVSNAKDAQPKTKTKAKRKDTSKTLKPSLHTPNPPSTTPKVLTERAQFALERIGVGRETVHKRVGDSPEQYLEQLYHTYITPDSNGMLPELTTYEDEVVFFDTGLKRMRMYCQHIREDCGQGKEYDEAMECCQYISDIERMVWNVYCYAMQGRDDFISAHGRRLMNYQRKKCT